MIILIVNNNTAIILNINFGEFTIAIETANKIFSDLMVFYRLMFLNFS